MRSTIRKICVAAVAVMVAVQALQIASLSAEEVTNKPSPLNGLKGKQLQLVWSGNDVLCRKIFDFYDNVYDPMSSEIFHEEDELVVSWKVAENILGTVKPEWVKEDIDNDGVDDILIRTHNQKHNEHHDNIIIVKPEEIQNFFAINHDVSHLNKNADFAVSFSDAPINKADPRKGADIVSGHGYYNLIKHKFPQRPGFSEKYFHHDGRLSLIRYERKTYLMAYHSIDLTMGDSLWGVLLLIQPDRTGDDICYFDRLKPLKK